LLLLSSSPSLSLSLSLGALHDLVAVKRSFVVRPAWAIAWR
jgi:hypothetical protein